MSYFRKIAIANRGEVACRVLKACRTLNIPTVLLHSTADVKTMAFRLADETIAIGPPPAQDSYLNIQANVLAAQKAKADALHPGFGFLSENAEFAKAVESAGITFIGPSHKAIASMGDKTTARQLMMEAGVPVIPGEHSPLQTDKYLEKRAKQIGFPILIKAVMGGGGRGIKIARSPEEFLEQLHSARREALAAFGSDRVFLEKYMEKARHIEFQIFGDHYGQVVHLFERDCSIQRRHQKIIEESPALGLTKEQHQQMAGFAVQAAKAVGYVGAGTVEFLFDGQQCYFLEMNTRLQVEHPVTEMLLGVDLVKAQIQVAAKQELGFKPSDLKPVGHVMECRVCGEDPYQGGLPSTGVVFQKWAEKFGRRFDCGLGNGDEISSFYDSMFAKIIVKGKDRLSCLQEMNKALEESYVFGIQTNIEYLKAILNHPAFVKGSVATAFIETHFDQQLAPKKLSYLQEEFQNRVQQRVYQKRKFQEDLSVYPSSPFLHSHKWVKPQMQIEDLDILADHQKHTGVIGFLADDVWLHFQGHTWHLEGVMDGHEQLQTQMDDVRSNMPGKVLKILVGAGDRVKVGDMLLALEAMKMEYQIKAPRDGVVESIPVELGQAVGKGQLLIHFAKE